MRIMGRWKEVKKARKKKAAKTSDSERRWGQIENITRVALVYFLLFNFSF